MSRRDDDVERLMRIRDRQLQARDPKKKDHKMHQRIAKRHTKRNAYTPRQLLREMVSDIPHKWQGVILGVLIGTAIDIGLALFVQAAWVTLVGIAILVILPILGFTFGGVLDWRKELEDDVRQL